MTLAEVLREEGFEKGVKKGEETGIEKGETRAFLKVAIKALTKKFGFIPAEYREKVDQLDVITLEALTEEIDKFSSIEDLKKFLGI